MYKQPYLREKYYVLEGLGSGWYKGISPACETITEAREWRQQAKALFPNAKYIGRWVGWWVEVVGAGE